MIVETELKQRIMASLSEVPAPTRAQVLRGHRWLWGCGITGALVIFFLSGGVRLDSRPFSLMALSSVGTALIVGAGAFVLFTRGHSLPGRPISWLLATAVGCSLLFIAWRYGVSVLYERVEPWPERTGLRCLGVGVATGALPLLAALLSWRRAVSLSPVATGAALGAGAGLGSALLVDLWCPVSYLPHLLRGHLLPICALALVGGLVGSRILRVRRL